MENLDNSQVGLLFHALHGFPASYMQQLHVIISDHTQLEADIIRRVMAIESTHGQPLTASERERMVARALEFFGAGAAAAAVAQGGDDEDEEEEEEEEEEWEDEEEEEDELTTDMLRVRDLIKIGHSTPESLDAENRFLVDDRKQYPVVYCADVVYAVYQLCEPGEFEPSQLADAYKCIIEGHSLVPREKYAKRDAEEWIYNGTMLMSFSEGEGIGCLTNQTHAELEESLLYILRDEEFSVENRVFICAHAISVLANVSERTIIKNWQIPMSNETPLLRDAVQSYRDNWLVSGKKDDDDMKQEGLGVHPVTCVDLIIRGGFTSLVAPFLDMYLDNADMRMYMNRKAFELDESFDPADKDPVSINAYGMAWQVRTCVTNLMHGAYEVDMEHIGAHMPAVEAFFAHRKVKEVAGDTSRKMQYIRNILTAMNEGNPIIDHICHFFGVEVEPDETKVERAWRQPMEPEFLRYRRSLWKYANMSIRHGRRHAAIKSGAKLPLASKELVKSFRECGAFPNGWDELKRLIRVDESGGDPLDFVPTGERLERIRLHAERVGDGGVLERIKRVKKSRLELVNSVAVTTDAFLNMRVGDNVLALDHDNRLTFTANGQIAFTNRTVPNSVVGIIHSMVSQSAPAQWEPLSESSVQRAIGRMIATIKPMANQKRGTVLSVVIMNAIRHAAFSILTDVRLNPRLFVGVQLVGSSDGSSSSKPPPPLRESIITLLIKISEKRNFKLGDINDMFKSLVRMCDMAVATKRHNRKAVEDKRMREDSDDEEQKQSNARARI